MAKTHVTIPFFIPHFGCNHRCVFCNQVYSTNKIKLPDEDDIIHTIERYIKTIKRTVSHIEIAFFGGSFTGLPNELQRKYLAIAHRYYSLHTINGIRLSTRPDLINNDILSFLKEYNVTTIELGAQSFHDDVLQKSKRGHTVSDIIQASTLIKQHGFNCIIQLMPGLPGDTYEKSVASAHTTCTLKPNGVRIYPTIVIKNTDLEKMYYEGTYTPLSLEEAVALCSELYALFLHNSIPVIRMGVHPFDENVKEAIIAGPYHPSFGYLAKSRYYRNKLQSLIENNIQKINPDTRVVISLPYINITEYFGPHKENIDFLRAIFNTININFTISDIDEPVITFD